LYILKSVSRELYHTLQCFALSYVNLLCVFCQLTAILSTYIFLSALAGFHKRSETVNQKGNDGIILLLTRITSFHVYILERYDICMIHAIPALRVTSNHAYVISL